LGRMETHNISTIHISTFTSCSQAIFSFFQSYSQVNCLVKKHVRSLACSFSAPTFKEACHGLQLVRIDLLQRKCLPTGVPCEINRLLVSSHASYARKYSMLLPSSERDLAAWLAERAGCGRTCRHPWATSNGPTLEN
jgi:hypothetical protein